MAYAERLKVGSVSASEIDAIKRVFNARKERLEQARAKK
jgi:hypothetical protein